MFKSLTARAIIPVTVSVTGFVIVCCILLYAIMKTDMTNDVIRYETSQAGTIVKSTRYAMLHDDRESLSNTIANIGTQEGVEHARIFNKKGLIMFSSNSSEIGRLLDKNAAGCVECHSGPVPAATLGDMKQARRFVNEKGKDVIAITAPIYNEPSCYPGRLSCSYRGAEDLGHLGHRSVHRAPGQQSGGHAEPDDHLQRHGPFGDGRGRGGPAPEICLHPVETARRFYG